MSADLTLDDRLITRAIEAGHHRNAEEAVTAALQEYVHSHEPATQDPEEPQRRPKILDWIGKVEYFDDYDPKQLRLPPPHPAPYPSAPELK